MIKSAIFLISLLLCVLGFVEGFRYQGPRFALRKEIEVTKTLAPEELRQKLTAPPPTTTLTKVQTLTVYDTTTGLRIEVAFVLFSRITLLPRPMISPSRAPFISTLLTQLPLLISTPALILLLKPLNPPLQVSESHIYWLSIYFHSFDYRQASYYQDHYSSDHFSIYPY